MARYSAMWIARSPSRPKQTGLQSENPDGSTKGRATPLKQSPCAQARSVTMADATGSIAGAPDGFRARIPRVEAGCSTFELLTRGSGVNRPPAAGARGAFHHWAGVIPSGWVEAGTHRHKRCVFYCRNAAPVMAQLNALPHCAVVKRSHDGDRQVLGTVRALPCPRSGKGTSGGAGAETPPAEAR